jgi:hypothetical protein
MTNLQSYVDFKSVYVSRNIIHVHLNIITCTSRLRQQNRPFEQIYSTFYESKTLTSTSNINMAELFNHKHDLHSITGTACYSRPRTSNKITEISIAHHWAQFSVVQRWLSVMILSMVRSLWEIFRIHVTSLREE